MILHLRLVLQRPAAPAAGAPAGAAAPAPAGALRVLVVDDSSTVRKLLTRLLRRANFVVDEAENGLQALKLLCGEKKGQHDVALVGFLMPVLDGISCVSQFREWEREQRPPPGDRAAAGPASSSRAGAAADADDARPAPGRLFIVGISANADTQDVSRARDMGMDEFLTKPINIERLSLLLHSRFGVTLASPRPSASAGEQPSSKRVKVA